MERPVVCIPPAVLLLLLLLMMMMVPNVAPEPCPRPCSCPQPAELHCTFRSLLSIPAAVSKRVERINLGFNSINKITDKSLSGLRKLELLMIHGNDITTLPHGAFRDLTSLQMLKMSYNKLKEINRHTLQGLGSLARLHLDHNRLEFIHPDAFHGLASLRLLQLEGNRLQQLHPDSFTTFTLMGHFHVSTLRHLYLSDNGLTSLPSRLLEAMPQLENLYLHGNPWTCDCNMRWLRVWYKSSPGVLKCKKDRALPGGQLCPMCSSPRHLRSKELLAVENLVCSSPVISSLHRTSPSDDVDSEVMTREDFREPFGNVSLGLSDEHGNQVDLECGIGEPRELTKINWEQLDKLQLASNITLSVDLECPVGREKYEQLWRLIAYYSNVPAHLRRGMMLRKEPHPTYVYKQDSEKDAQYYTGVKVNIMAQPAWLMQTSADLQLNRLQSSAKMVKLTLSTNFSETVEAELVQRQTRTWVMIESTNTTRTVLTAILGSASQMYCKVHSSGQPVINWMLTDGSKVEAPYSSPDKRVSVSSDGQLDIKAVSHTDAGIYYCIAKVHGDLAVMPFHLSVQESSSPPPGEDASITPIEVFTGRPVSLPCTASGSPDAEINWILPNRNIVSFQANSSRTLVDSNGSLHIPQTQLMDSGYYKCIAVNQHGVDTLATKITFMPHKGTIRPLKRFPAAPQSASGVNTQIEVPTENSEDASADIEVTQLGAPLSRLDPLRRRVPGGLAPGRRGIYPSRTMRRRPPLLGKSTVSHVEDRRKISMPKTKIDPEKWADILAKIRDRNPDRNTVTPLPVQYTAERKLTEQTTALQDTFEGSSDGMSDFTTPHTPTQYTQMKTDKHTTTKGLNWYPHTTSNSVFFLPQLTTSVPLHAVTFWQANTNTASSSGTFSLQEHHSTTADVDRVKTADGSKALQRSGNTERPNVLASSNNDQELSSRGSEIIPTVNPNESETNQEENGKYKETLDGLQSQEMLTTVSPITTIVFTTTKRTGSEEQSPPRLRQTNSKRRNGGRRRRPNKRKQKLNKPTQFIGTTRTTASTQLKIHLLEVTTANLNTTVPFRGSQATSSGRLSHEESTVSGRDDEAGTKLFSRPSETNESHPALAKPLVKSSSPASSFPTASPEMGHGKTSSHTALRISEIASASERSDVFTSITQWRFTGSPPPPVKPLEETQRVSFTGDLGPTPRSSNSSGGFHAVTQMQTDVRQNESDQQHVPTEKGEQMLLKVTDRHSSLLLPTLSASAASLMEHEIRTTSEYTSSGFIKSWLSMLFVGDSDTDQITTKKSTIPEKSYHSSSKNKTTSSESELEHHPKETTNIGSNVDELFTSTVITKPPSATSSRPDAVIPSTVGPHRTLPKPMSTGAEMGPSLRATTEKAPSTIVIPNNQNMHHIIKSDVYPTTQPTDPKLALFMSTNPTSPALILTSGRTIKQTATPAPTISAIPTDPFREGLLTSPQDVSRKQQLPGQGSIPRGKPRITKSNFQTLTVEAETDAQLPCGAEGEPMPFLSWTKVASGASIAQNIRIQRFEVHPNGTLTIKNTQPTDGGQYLCMVQNQHGTDKMVVNLVVFAQRPRILQPQHRDITVSLGGKVDLECNAVGHPTPRVTWTLPNHVHVAADGFATQQNVAVFSNGTLRINPAAYADQGIYKCSGSSTAGVDTVSVRLYVSALLPVIQQMRHENTTLLEGANAYIHCSATGGAQPQIRWITPDGVQLIASQFVNGRKLGVFPNGTLYIQGLGLGNAGRYQCLASNAVASSTRTVILSIRRNPSSAKAHITSSSPQRTDVIYGGRLLLNCVAAGGPEPRIIWRTPSKKLVDAQYSFDPRIKVFPNGSITVHSVTEKDGGDYLCVARNKMGDDYVQLRVDVLTRPAKIEQKQQRSSQEVVYGGDLKVDCVASGLPNPEISWALPDGTMLNPIKERESLSGGRTRRYVVFDNGTLYFNHVGTPEEGDYTCYAENQLGKDEMKVRVKVKVATSPPKIQDKDQNIIRVFYGETVTLKCNAKGEPTPVVTWISPTNRVIAPAMDKYQVLDDGTLVVQKVQRSDDGNYTCMSRNNVGQDHKVIRLEVLVTSPMINGLKGTLNAIKVTAVADQRTLVDCIAEGMPIPRIMWVLPGNVILPAPYYSNRMTVHPNGTLEIRLSKRTDSGQLACIARNEGGEVKLIVNLIIKETVERAQIRGTNTDNLSLTVGNSVTLNCSFESATLPHVTWILPNGTPLHSGARFSKVFHRPTDGSLIISNPSVAEAGMYRCLGQNSRGLVERTFTLSPGKKPEIINRYNSPVSVVNGEGLFLHCLTNAEPFRLTWTLPSGVVLNRPQRSGRYAVLPNGTLSIHQVSVYDRGLYSCRAANEYGSSQLSVSVIVVAYPPRITNGPRSVTYAKHGVAVQLNCVATGIPRVEVAWETPDKTRLAVSAQPRLFGNKYLHPQGSLVIQNPTQRDAGVYRCTARNAIGKDSKATILNVF
ncbi:matrix-remodeling-associated protein 5 [Etheostoma spectabile]|uniref:matrix-remodeling-associated protein 5 n=1 Tax=Etheostoma spectabile TaxID=54343 RepID=UPI0013AFE2BB|nr:matrix-remodeling-associated protein 5 [Etheostoma spectabile]